MGPEWLEPPTFAAPRPKPWRRPRYPRLLIDDDAALDLALQHLVEGVVQIAERDAPADHLLEAIPAAHIKVDQHRDVRALVSATERATREHALLEQEAGVDGQPCAGRRHADHDAGAAPVGGEERLLDGPLRAHNLEGEVDAAGPAERLDARHRVLPGGIDDVGGPELLRPRELLLHHVDGDDLGGAHQACRLDGVEPDTAAAPHRDARARRHLRAVEDGTGAGEDRKSVV